jgi:hypothetical protein
VREPPLKELAYRFDYRSGSGIYQIYWRAVLNEPRWSWFQSTDEGLLRSELDERWYQAMLHHFAVERAEAVLGFSDLQRCSPHKIMQIREVLEMRSGFVRSRTPIGSILDQSTPLSIYILPQYVL